MIDFLSRHKKAFIISISAVCLVLLIYSASERYRPGIAENSLGVVVSGVARFFNGIGSWIGDNVSFLLNMSSLAAENEELRAQILRMEMEFGRLLLVEEQNNLLQELMDIQQRYSDFPIIGADIIARDPGNWFDTFMINRGSRDGLQSTMAVLAPGGLAGMVTHVGFNHATVITLIHYTSSVGAQTHRTGDAGIVRGDITLMSDGVARMNFTNPEADFAVGDDVITSSLSSIYPPGIMIGRIIEVVNEGNTRYAVIQPAVDFSRLQTLLVISELFEFELIDEYHD